MAAEDLQGYSNKEQYRLLLDNKFTVFRRLVGGKSFLHCSASMFFASVLPFCAQHVLSS